jgi:hypothetical protein
MRRTRLLRRGGRRELQTGRQQGAMYCMFPRIRFAVYVPAYQVRRPLPLMSKDVERRSDTPAHVRLGMPTTDTDTGAGEGSRRGPTRKLLQLSPFLSLSRSRCLSISPSHSHSHSLSLSDSRNERVAAWPRRPSVSIRFYPPSNMLRFCKPSWKHRAPNPNAEKPRTLARRDMAGEWGGRGGRARIGLRKVGRRWAVPLSLSVRRSGSTE